MRWSYRFLHRQRLREILDSIQEHKNLVSGPRSSISSTGREVAILPLLGKSIADINEGGIKFGLGREAGVVESAFPVDRCDLVLQAGVFRSAEEVKESSLEIVRIQGLGRPRSKVVRDELVEVFAANQTVEVVDKVKALLVGHSAEGIIGVDALVADGEPGKRVVLAKLGDRLLYDMR